MRLRSLLISAGLCIAVLAPSAATASAASCAGADLPAAQQNVQAMSSATLCLLNDIRAEHHLKTFRANPTLTKVADGYAHRMVADTFFDHTAPDGTTFLQRIQRTSYLHGAIRSWSVGENIAWGTGTLATPAAIVDAWMHSAGHRANILNGAFTEVGISATVGAPTPGAAPDAATYVNDFGQRVR